MVLKPPTISFEAAAAVPLAGLTALQGLRDHGRAQAGDDVLIHGAGGGVGTCAVQIAKSFGARVTAVCSARSAVTVRSVGADDVIDYTRDDFCAGSTRYDVVLVVNGTRAMRDYVRVLKPEGRCVVIGGAIRAFVHGMILATVGGRASRRRLRVMMTNPNQPDLLVLRGMLDGGSLVPVVDRRYALAEVPVAVRYLAEGHTRGKVVITVV
jgi:NADPH:quinone reductase-like Zn-dependent oxidoreductase